MGNQSQDEVFLAAQEAVGAHRDSQGKICDPVPTNPLPHSKKSISDNVIIKFITNRSLPKWTSCGDGEGVFFHLRSAQQNFVRL